MEEACRHDEERAHLAVTDFWAKLNQVLVTAGSDLYARETKAKISTPQDTLDARQSQKSDARLGPSFGHREGETHLHRMEDLLDILEVDSNGA